MLSRLVSKSRSVAVLFGLLASGISSTLAVDSPSTYGKGDCLMENCLQSQSGYLDGYNFDPTIVGGPTWGQVWATQTQNGEQYLAQPITFTPAGASQSVIVASELNRVTVLDAATGVIRQQRTLYPPFTSIDAQCADLAPYIGITGTPVLDPSRNTLYFWSKAYADGTTAGLLNGRYRFYGVDPVTLQDRFPPVDLQGTQAGNRADEYFEGGKVLQRTGLLLANGIVYAGFGGHCDNFNYTGWIVGMDAASGKYVTSFSTQSGPFGGTGSGVWQAGGGLSYDGTNMWFATGNGFGEELGAMPRQGRNPPGALSMAVVKMAMRPNLTAVDFFAPSDYRALDAADQDFGSSGVAFLPTGFSAGNVGRLAIANGKNSKAYVMNADNLGGYKTGNGGGDGVLQIIPLGGQSFSTAGAYPFEGGYVYISATGQPTMALKFGTDSNGNPSFAQVGQTEDSSTNYRGVGHTTVTSNQGQPGSGLLWVTDIQNGNLRVYKAVPPSDGIMRHVFVGNLPQGGSKYQRPVPGNGRMFVVSTSGHVTAWGAPVNLPLNCTSSLSFGTVTVGANATLPVTCQATIRTTVSSFKISDATTFKTSPITNVTLAAKQSFSFNVTWSPSVAGIVAGTVTLNTTNGVNGYVNTVPIILRGTAVASGASFSMVPTNIAFGGLVPGAADTVGGLNKTVSLINQGLQPLRITTWDFDETYGAVADDDDDDAPTPAPSGDVDGEMDRKTTTGNFTLFSMPSTVSAQSSTALVINFNPTIHGTYTALLKIYTNGGNLTAVITGSAAGASKLTFSTEQFDGTLLKDVPYMDYGNVLAGSTKVQSLRVTNEGESALIISKSKPPTSEAFHALNPAGDLTEGEAIEPEETEAAAIQLSSPITQVNLAPYNVSGTWVLNANDPTFGVHFINMSARIVTRMVGPKLPTPLAGDVNGTSRYQYLGCYADVAGNQTLPTLLQGTDKSFENGQCQTLAAAQGGSANFAGSMYSQECWVGITVPDPARRVPEEYCSMKCIGDTSQYCGAGGYLSVFYDSLAYDPVTRALKPGAYQGPKIVPSVGSYKYVDCVSETQPRALGGASYINGTGMTVEGCVNFCQSNRFALAGVEYGGECYCDSALSSSSKRNQTGCSVLCPGNKGQLCGGASRISLYALNGNLTAGFPATTTTTTSSTSATSTTTSATASSTAPGGLSANDKANYLGCRVEANQGRTLPQLGIATDSLTIGLCRSTCAGMGYTMAGAEYGRECWCGSSFTLNTSWASSDRDCSQPCAGNTAQICGNGGRLSVYNAGNGTTPSSSTTSSSSSTTSTTSKTSSVSSPTPSSGLSADDKANYLGCRVEATQGRTLPQLGIATDNLTISLCRSTCYSMGFALAGAEYGRECWCGGPSFALNTTWASSDSECSQPCSGSTSSAPQVCGNGSRLSVYYAKPGNNTAAPSSTSTSSRVTSSASTTTTSSRTTTTTTSTTSSSSPSSTNAAAYKGCYTEATSGRALPYPGTGGSIGACRASCSARGYQIAGLEYYGECYCSNSLPASSTRAPESDCNTPCSNNPKEICGGASRLSIYSDAADISKIQVTQPPVVGSYTSMGCYIDDASNRIIGNDATPALGANNSVSSCAAACKGYSYMGVEFGQECHCGSTLRADAVNTDLSQCNMPCVANASMYCGAASRMGLYRLTSLSSSTSSAATSTSARSSSSSSSGSSTKAVSTTTSSSTASRSSSTSSLTSSRSTSSTSSTSARSSTTTSSTSSSFRSSSTTSSTSARSSSTTSSTSSTTSRSSSTSSSTSSRSSTTTSATSSSSRSSTNSSTSSRSSSTTSTASSTSRSSSMTTSTTSRATSSSSSIKPTTTTLPASAQTLTASALPSTLKPLGCFLDVALRPLTVQAYLNNRTTSVTGCSALCSSRGYRYSGVSGLACYCDDFLSVSTTSTAGQATGCTTPCAGNARQICGGTSRMSITQDLSWKQTLFTVTKAAQWRFSDCWVDPVSPRLLNITLTPLNRTVEGCLARCDQMKLPLCGVENGYECFGAKALIGGSKIAPNTGNTNALARGCSTRCQGSARSACGGSARVSLYTKNATLPWVWPSEVENLA